MKLPILKNALFLILSGLLLFSCQQDKEIDLDSNTTLDNANAQGLFDDAMKMAEDALEVNNHAKLAAPGVDISTCATVDSIYFTSTYKRFTITFDPDCPDSDGKKRGGKLVIELDGATYNTPDAVMTIKSLDYTVNGTKLDGKKTVTCVSSGVHNIVVSDTTTGVDYGKITYASGAVAYWKSKRTRTLVSGDATATIVDNVYDISATSGVGNPAASGINREGRNYSVDITSPIRVNFNCFSNNTARYPTQGVLTLRPDGKTDRSIDYGSGLCDNKVTLSIGSFSKEIDLSY